MITTQDSQEERSDDSSQITALSQLIASYYASFAAGDYQQLYSFTIRNYQTGNIEYKPQLDILNDNGNIIKLVFQEENKLHVHGILQAKKGLRYESLCIKPYHLNMSELRTNASYKRWFKYIDQPKKDVLKKNTLIL